MMNYAKIRAGLALSSVAVLLLGAACRRNHPPTVPAVTGRSLARPGDTVRLTAVSTDQDDDLISYLFAWGDTSSTGWSADYPSGVTVTRGHVYAESGKYIVRVRAKDERDAESNWSDTVVLTVGDSGQAPPARAWQRGAFEPVSANIKCYGMPGGLSFDSLYGYGSHIPASSTPLYMVVTNWNAGNTQVTFPAGLVFSPSDPEYSYTILLQDFSFTAQVGMTDSILLPTYVCNKSLREPGHSSFYCIVGVEWDQEFQTLLDLLAPKALVSGDDVDLVQEAVYEITEYAGLTDSTKARLQSLP